MLSRKTGTCCGFFSLLVAAFSVLVLLEFDDFYRDILNKQVSITEGSSAFRMWKDVSSGFDMSANLYFFNITNVEQVKQGRANPRLREMGPYAYRMEWVKDNITFNDNGTVSFLEKIIFHFDSENSVGSEDDLVTTVNVPYVAALHLLNGQNVLVRILGRPVLSKLSQGLYLTRSVRQLSFEGYPDVLMMLAAAAQKKNSAAGSSSSSAGFDIASVLRSAHRTQVDTLKNQPESEVGRFSYMTGRNDTFHELLTMFTGEGNISQINYLDSIDGKRKLNTWSGDLCDQLRGSFGNVRTPLSPPSPETVFIPDLKRAFTLHHVADTKVSSLSTRRYALTSDSFDPASPEHSCYNAARSYLPAGVADLGPLQEGAPIVLSLPHFLHGSSSLFTGVEGLYPDKDRHLFYIDSEPITGAAVSARVRLQLNVLLDQVPNFWSSSELGYTVLPLFWQEVVPQEPAEDRFGTQQGAQGEDVPLPKRCQLRRNAIQQQWSHQERQSSQGCARRRRCARVRRPPRRPGHCRLGRAPLSCVHTTHIVLEGRDCFSAQCSRLWRVFSGDIFCSSEAERGPSSRRVFQVLSREHCIMDRFFPRRGKRGTVNAVVVPHR